MSKQASRRVAQFNLLFTPSELRELKLRAIQETGGNISELIRRCVFPEMKRSEVKQAREKQEASV